MIKKNWLLCFVLMSVDDLLKTIGIHKVVVENIFAIKVLCTFLLFSLLRTLCKNI